MPSKSQKNTVYRLLIRLHWGYAWWSSQSETDQVMQIEEKTNKQLAASSYLPSKPTRPVAPFLGTLTRD